MDRSAPGPERRGLTLVEMLVAMAVTLLIMAAVVTVFANVTSSVSNRRATIEMSSALRNVRETLARDLAGATCPTVPWRRPEANEGYLEILEGPQNDYYPSPWLWDGADADALPDAITATADALPGIDLALSSLPGSNLRAPGVSLDDEGRGLVLGSGAPLPDDAPTDGRGLGDADDILMLTVRNESEPFIGRIPKRVANRNTGASDPASRTFIEWGTRSPDDVYEGGDEQVDSPLAEVVWFALENPVERRTQRTFAFGEAGYRTIYRRTLLILPELDYGIQVDGESAGPGVVRVLNGVGRSNVRVALAGLVAFQDRYDLSVRLEWNPQLDGGRWVIRANTLGDLTKRENRYEHHGYVPQPTSLLAQPDNPGNLVADRYFPFAAYSAGVHSGAASLDVRFAIDRDVSLASPANLADFQAISRNLTVPTVVAYEPAPATSDAEIVSSARRYRFRPFAFLDDSTDTPATVRAVLNEDGNVVHVTRGMAPLGGARRGEDVMMTDALAFDVRVYDPGAPVYGYFPNGDTSERADAIVQPGDPAWDFAYHRDAAVDGVGLDRLASSPAIPQTPATSETYPFAYERQGAYVDLGYGSTFFELLSGGNLDLTNMQRRFEPQRLAAWSVEDPRLSLVEPQFGIGYGRLDPRNGAITLPIATTPIARTNLVSVYDTWSWHYETNGLNEDADDSADEGADGLDGLALYPVDTNDNGFEDELQAFTRYGPDDPAERETRPPYESALRGLQVTLRTYERDSRQIREVKVRESFVPE